MKTILLVWITLSVVASADTLGQLIADAMQNDPTIELLEARKQVASEETASADLWENPVLKAGVTDIRPDAVTDRSLEPMQTQFIAVSQKIPLRDRYRIAREIAVEKEALIDLKIAERRRTILSRISDAAYRIAIAKRRLVLLGRNRANLRRIQVLLRGYQASEDLLLETEKSMLLLDTKAEKLKSRIEAERARITRYTLHATGDIDLSLKPRPLHDKRYDPDHPLLQLYRKDIAIAQKRIALMEAKERPDITLSAGYYQRVDREDYLSVGISMPLQIRGREKIATQKARAMLLYQRAKLAETANRFAAEVRVLSVGMEEGMRNYRRFEKRIVPLQRRISRYLAAKNSSGALDLTRVVESYNSVIALEDASLEALSDYFRNYAKLRYYR